MSARMRERLPQCILVVCALLGVLSSLTAPESWGNLRRGFCDGFRTGAVRVAGPSLWLADSSGWDRSQDYSDQPARGPERPCGVTGAGAARLVLVLAVALTVLVYNLRSGTGLFVSGAVTLLVAGNLGIPLGTLPQAATTALFAAMLLVLQASFAGWRDRWLVPVPRSLEPWLGITRERFPQPDELGFDGRRGRWLWIMPMILMIGSHCPGGFGTGLAVYLACLGLRGLEAYCVRRRWAGGILRRLAMMAAAGLLGTMVNPWTWRLPWEAGISVLPPPPRVAGAAGWNGDLFGTQVGPEFLILLFISLFAMASSRRERDFTQLSLWALLSWLAMIRPGEVQSAAVAAGFWLAPHLESALARFRPIAAGGAVPGEPVPGGPVSLCRLLKRRWGVANWQVGSRSDGITFPRCGLCLASPADQQGPACRWEGNQ